MSIAWDDGLRPPEVKITPMGWVRVALRAPVMVVVMFGALGLTALLRLIEKPLFGLHRPLTPIIAKTMFALCLFTMGLKLRVSGQIMKGGGAIVSNHASWLDIFVLNARKQVYFVAKAEIADWPVASWFAKIAGTVFIKRDRREAAAQVEVFRERLEAGHKLLFFPEGTSSDSRRVLPFKTTLFAAFFAESLRTIMRIQPVTLIYRAPDGRDPRFYGWWGDMEMGPSLLTVLAQPRQGEVEMVYHEPIEVSEFADRKALAAYCEATVRAPLSLEIGTQAE